jgi:phosphoglycolate phosphatase-like HAD superfamily hydrolase
MNIFLDLDGTLLEDHVRFFAVHRAALGEHRVALAPEEYRRLKREQTPENEILRLHYPAVDAAAYGAARQRLLEHRSMLAYNRLFPAALAALQQLSGHHLFVITMRSDAQTLLEELEHFGIDGFFEEILSAPGGSAPWETKAALLRPYAAPRDWIVGDTEADVRGGKLAGIRTCALCSGIRTRAFLASLEPDLLLEGIADVPAAIAAAG